MIWKTFGAMAKLPVLNEKGFTALEILTVVVIISVLAMIAIPNFIHLQENAKEAQIETNCRTLRVMLETYRVDQKSYPEDLRTLGYEATLKKYNRTLENPYRLDRGPVESGMWAIDYLGTSGPAGMVTYKPLADGSKYYIFGYDKSGKLLKRNGVVYTMTNG